MAKTRKKKKELTAKQRKFAEEYLIDCNATQAAIRAGYSSKTAAAIGAENLIKPYIKKYIESKMEEISSRRIATAQEVQEYLTAVLRGESESEVIVVEGYGEGCSAAKRMKKRPDEKERLKAAELLGKVYSLFTTSVELSGVLVQIYDDIPDEPEQEQEGTE